MDWWLLTFFLGAILSLFLPEVPAIFQLIVLIFIAFGCFSHKVFRSSSGFLIGAAWMLLHAYCYQSQIPEEIVALMIAKQTLQIEGEVVSLQSKQTKNSGDSAIVLSNKTQKQTVRFNVKLDKINDYPLARPLYVRLSWKNAQFTIAQGHQLSLQVKLKPAHGLANLGSFHYASWLTANYIAASGYVVNPKSHKRKHKQNTKLDKTQAAFVIKKNEVLLKNSTIRQQLYDQYISLIPSHQLSPILLALAFGERGLLGPAHWQTLQTTGTSHLIAISGLHIGLLASGVFYIMITLVRYLPIKTSKWQSYNAMYLAIFTSLVFATIYAYLAGFSLPTERALVMLLLFWLSRLVGITLSMPRLLLITIFIVISISPFSLLTISFWLSFYAVIIIFLTLWRFKAWLTRGSALLRLGKGLMLIQLSLTLMLVPITAIAFQQISLVSLAANIFAVPWMSIITIPSALLSVFFVLIDEVMAQWLMAISLQSLSWLWQYLSILSELPYASVKLTLKEQRIVLMVGMIIFMLSYFPVKFGDNNQRDYLGLVKVMSFILLCALPFYSLLRVAATNINQQVNSNFESTWQVVFFDVGQGLSVLIKRNDRVVLYDTGAYYASGFNMSEAVILPYLQYEGINKIDKVIISHSDNDHAGGLEVLSNNIIIDEIITSDTGISKRPVKTCFRGNDFIWQGLKFEALSPTIEAITNNDLASKPSKNDNSCVIRVSDSHGRAVLLVGDISSKVERNLLSKFPKLSADILQVPHHGSKTSSGSDFIKQVSPAIAVVSAGYLNRWHMPVKAIEQRYLEENIKLLNTAQLGQIIITIDEDGINSRSFVNDFKPFWFKH
ncbi:DNA internalization-related competence protein ComEC/Rec2 [Colwelliaceae bacterium MEBiC 14330]